MIQFDALKTKISQLTLDLLFQSYPSYCNFWVCFSTGSSHSPRELNQGLHLTPSCVSAGLNASSLCSTYCECSTPFSTSSHMVTSALPVNHKPMLLEMLRVSRSYRISNMVLLQGFPDPFKWFWRLQENANLSSLAIGIFVLALSNASSSKVNWPQDPLPIIPLVPPSEPLPMF